MKLKYQTLSLFDKIATHFYVHCVECDAIVIMAYTLMYFMTGGSIFFFEHFFTHEVRQRQETPTNMQFAKGFLGAEIN